MIFKSFVSSQFDSNSWIMKDYANYFSVKYVFIWMRNMLIKEFGIAALFSFEKVVIWYVELMNYCLFQH